MKPVLERLHSAKFLAHISLHVDAGSVVVLAVRSNQHVVLRDLVSVLAGSGHLDWTGPVVVEVAQGIAELLNVYFGEG